ncbi:hypothetical protein Droror1_Dr00024319, partial [Drosera rotundifolia]
MLVLTCSRFSLKKGRNDAGEIETVEVTVYDYFVNKCGIDLRYSGDLPCINVGKPRRPTFFPLEQFYEFLTSKARPKKRSPTWSLSPPEEELSQRIEARLNAIEQKRREFTGISVMGINPETGKFCSHVNNDYFFVEGLLDVFIQLRIYKTPDLETPKYLILRRAADYERQLKMLVEEMQAINKGLERVAGEFSLSENDGPISEEFHKNLKVFLCSAESDVKSLALLYSAVGKNADALIIYFGEDPVKCPFEQ